MHLVQVQGQVASHRCERVYGSQESTSSVFLNHSPPCSQRQHCPLQLELSDQLAQLSRKSLDPQNQEQPGFSGLFAQYPELSYRSILFGYWSIINQSLQQDEKRPSKNIRRPSSHFSAFMFCSPPPNSIYVAIVCVSACVCIQVVPNPFFSSQLQCCD